MARKRKRKKKRGAPPFGGEREPRAEEAETHEPHAVAQGTHLPQPSAVGSQPPRRAASWRLRTGLAAVLFSLAVATFWPARNHDFVNYDDPSYVSENPTVQQGLNAQTLRWAWTTTDAANWHPLTWISHLADVEWFGLDAGAHHMTSVWLHACGTVLLFVAFGALSGGWRRSAVVAALFAVHPMHVESVAWIAERKDVLSGVLWMATLGAYAWYSARPSVLRYLAVLFALALGLTAKPMLVSLPFVLLLLDVWPLRREQGWARLVLEKLPLLGLAVASSVVTLAAQAGGQGFASPLNYAFSSRLWNAVTAYAVYLGKLFVPVDMAVFYPHPGNDIAPSRIGVALAVLLAVSALAWWQRRERPYVLVGWLWFVGTLVPVIGLVQVGGQAMADRYTYIPYIGAFVALVWGGHELLKRVLPGRFTVPALVVAALGPVLLLVPLARGQLAHWKDSITLFEHAMAVTERNHVARINLASHLGRVGRMEEALEHSRQALAIYPGSTRANYNMGLVLTKLGRHDEAERYLVKALEGDPSRWEVRLHIGFGMMRQRRFEEAFDQFARASSQAPTEPELQFNMGMARAAQRRWEDAAIYYRRAVELRPDYARAHFELSQSLFGADRFAEALDELRLARLHGYEVPPGMLDELARIVAERPSPE